MGFFSPWFLAGLATLGLPVFLHLLRRHASTPKPFSSLRFFEHREQSSIRHRRLRYFVLLSLRLLIFLLLVLCFANPFIRRSASSVAGERLDLFVVDNSFSMRAGTRLADAKREALAALSTRLPTDKSQVIALGSSVHFLTQVTQDPAALQAAIASIQPSDERGSYGELARVVNTMVAAPEIGHMPIQVYLFSDMQRAGMPASFNDVVMPSNVILLLHPIVRSAVPNWAVETVTAPGQVSDPKKVRVQAVVAGYNTPTARRTVSLVVNGKAVQNQTVSLPANGRTTVEFHGLDVSYGFSRCAVRIDSADALPADDQAWFAVERADPRPVLFIHESEDKLSPLYFGAALAAADQAAYTLDAVTAESVSGLQPTKFAFVVLSDVFALPTTFENDLVKYVRGGGGVLIAAGTTASRDSQIPVFGAKVMTARNYTISGQRYLRVGDADPTHPSVAHADRWSGVEFFYAVSVDPTGARVAVRLTDQTPVLLDKAIGEGHVLLLSSGLDNLTNDFPLSPDFVPFVEETARYLSGNERRGGSRQVDAFIDMRTRR